MCYFQNVKFEMFPEQPRLKGGYYQKAETEQQHRKRMREHTKHAAARNQAANANAHAVARIIALRPRLKVAE